MSYDHTLGIPVNHFVLSGEMDKQQIVNKALFEMIDTLPELIRAEISGPSHPESTKHTAEAFRRYRDAKRLLEKIIGE